MTKKRDFMQFSTKLGKTYLRLMYKSLLEGKGKSTIASTIDQRIKNLQNGKQTIKIADFGACEGDMLEEINKISNPERLELHGFDYNQELLSRGMVKYPHIEFHHKDLSIPFDEECKDYFDVALTVNTIHEVYSFGAKEFQSEKSKQFARIALENIIKTIKKNGTLVFYDGVCHQDEPDKKIQFKVRDSEVRKSLEKFAKEYVPLKVNFEKIGRLTYQTTIRDFTRFITKYRFLNSITWEMEKEESYQYYKRDEFLEIISELGMTVDTLISLRPRLNKWQELVEILTPDTDFPFEHIIIIATKE